MIRNYLNAFQIGIVAGMRSMTAPAFVSHKLAHTASLLPPDSKLHFLTSPTTANVLNVLAGGEFIGDKLPNMANRTSLPQLSGRILSGAVAGAALTEAEGHKVGYGALIGGLGAVVGSFAFFHLRHWLTHEQHLPDPVVALAEDVIAVGAGWLVVSKPSPLTTTV